MQSSEIIAVLEKNSRLFHPVVPFDPATDLLTALDFTHRNTTLTKEILNDTGRFAAWVNHQLTDAHSRYGIGGYGEHRTIYSFSEVFDGNGIDQESRRLHLGTDIWGPAGTKIMAPLEGTIHSFAFNDRVGDYGATIILAHLLEGIPFYTLYGHLSLNAIKNIQPGDRIGKGEIFADLGIPAENGGWPPHLHLQIINSIEGFEGDYPGVCKYSEREKWLANSPDPELILQMKQFTDKISTE